MAKGAFKSSAFASYAFAGGAFAGIGIVTIPGTLLVQSMTLYVPGAVGVVGYVAGVGAAQLAAD